jgi:hypothetical protein
MSEGNRREQSRRRDFMERQHADQRGRRLDEPAREERRQRFPDETYGGEPDRNGGGDRQSHDAHRHEGMRGWMDEDRRGADYRGDFGPEGLPYYRRNQRTGHGWDLYAREGDDAGRKREQDDRPGGAREVRTYDTRSDRGNAGASFGFGPGEGVADRNSEERARYGYSSPYGQGDLNSDRPGQGDWHDSDWMPNRPARGRGTWAGDWADASGNIGMADYRGRGPKDYRRSDDRIREEVCDRFTDDPRLDASDVAVKVENGDVILTGTVADRGQKRRAEDIAERVNGVADVINQLRVLRGEPAQEAAQARGEEKTARGGAIAPADVVADQSNKG